MKGEPRQRSRRSSRRRRRPARRSEQHRSAQAEAGPPPPLPDLDDPLVCNQPPEQIDSAAVLDDLLVHVRSVGSFAFDTEFIGEESYYPRFCLIQIATPERVALVDPLAGLDVTPVWEAIADPGVETVVHAGQQDLEPAPRLLDRPPAEIFDTQIAAAFLDLPYPVSLRKLVEELVGVRIGKAFSFTRWDQRPLREGHLRYAADDVRYLPALRQRIGERLNGAGYGRWVREECEGLCDPGRYRFDPDARVERLLNNRSMRAAGRRLLRELVVFRDRTARARDLPPRSLLKDDVLIRLAKQAPGSAAELADVKGLPRPFRERYGKKLVAIAGRALDEGAAESAPPRTPDESTADRLRIDSLWALVTNYCRAHSIDPALVTTRRQIARLFFARTGGKPGLESNLDAGWRHEFVGAVVLELLAGKRRIEFEWRQGRLRVVS